MYSSTYQDDDDDEYMMMMTMLAFSALTTKTNCSENLIFISTNNNNIWTLLVTLSLISLSFHRYVTLQSSTYAPTPMPSISGY